MAIITELDILWFLKLGGVLAVILAYQIFRLVWNRTINRIASFRSLSTQRVVAVRRAGQNIGRVALVAVIALIISIEFQGIMLLLGAVSATIGIAFFAQWSILSNVTTGIIMFWRFPIRIGDRIGILGAEGSSGVVEEITPFFIILKNEQGNTITIPNNQTLQQMLVIYGPGCSERATEERDPVEATPQN